MRMFRLKVIGIGMAALLLWGAGEAVADPSVAVTQSLRFGNIMPRDNRAVYGLEISTSGVVTPIGNGLFEVDGGPIARNGVFELTGFQPGDMVSVTFDPPQIVLSCGCGGSSFTVDSFAISPSSIVIDGSGSQVVNFGATLKTDGSGVNYSGASYNGTVTISFIVDNI